MRIAGDTIRRNYLSRYEKNYSDKYDSEKKIYSGRQFDRASENPINAARALRVRRTISEVESYQDNLKTADSIYTNAESSMLLVSSIIQSVYEKLVEGAHGTRNQDDLNIIANDIDNYAEEMVQSLNIDIADRKVFGGTNNTTVAFKIENGYDGEKFVTYNGVAVNSSNDPDSFPFSESSYLDIGIGMDVDGNTNRIDDQSALPVTFNGVKCTGCGVASKITTIDLSRIYNDTLYKINVSVGGRNELIAFQGGASEQETLDNINAELRNKFQVTPELTENGTFRYAGENPEWYTYGTPTITDGDKVDFNALENGTYYSMDVKANGKVRTIDFKGGENVNDSRSNLIQALNEAFGEKNISVSSLGVISGTTGKKVEITADSFEIVPADENGAPDLSALTDGNSYAINLNGKYVSFTAGATEEETRNNLNEAMKADSAFGSPNVPYVNEFGVFCHTGSEKSITISNASDAKNQVEYTEKDGGYSNNIMQLVLDSAKALRDGDQQLVARYADLIFAAQSSLSVAISDLGTHSKFIEFNQDRLADVMINLNSKQNDIESTDLPSEITNWKVLESVYNASLQMGASVLSQSIFNYIS